MFVYALHIGAGTIGLVSGLVAAFARKGGICTARPESFLLYPCWLWRRSLPTLPL